MYCFSTIMIVPQISSQRRLLQLLFLMLTLPTLVFMGNISHPRVKNLARISVGMADSICDSYNKFIESKTIIHPDRHRNNSSLCGWLTLRNCTSESDAFCKPFILKKCDGQIKASAKQFSTPENNGHDQGKETSTESHPLPPSTLPPKIKRANQDSKMITGRQYSQDAYYRQLPTN